MPHLNRAKRRAPKKVAVKRSTPQSRSSLLLRAGIGIIGLMIPSAWLVTRLVERSYQNSPVGLTATTLEISPQLTPDSHQLHVPIFYSILNLPKTFMEQPVTYELSYQAGPPNHFIAQIRGHLSSNILLSFDGPRTPDPVIDRKIIRSCFTSTFSFQCLATRQRTLQTWTQDLMSESSKEWSLQWFQVLDASIGADEQTQGIHVSTKTENHILDHWILIQPSGTQQVIHLARPPTPEGQKAFEQVSQSIASLRNYPELQYGRELIDRTLGEVQLDSMKNESDPAIRLSKLMETQILLISKVSVEPSSLDSFFHLAGISTLILRQTDPNLPLPDPKDLPLNRIVQGNLAAAYLYARDLDALDPKTSQIQALWLSAGKDAEKPGSAGASETHL